MISLLQRAEAVLVWLLYHGFGLLPLDSASALGGRIARAIGPYLPPSRRARRNLELALPGADHPAIIRDMWENLGRMVGEYPHSERFSKDPGLIELVGTEHLDWLREDGKKAIFFTGHVGNWELCFPLMARLRLRGSGVYRAPNNPYLTWLFDRRAIYPDLDTIPKGPIGARRSIEALNKGRSLALLVDQKMNDGIEVPFFGIPAMTAPALASLALKFKVPVIPFRLVRLHGARFRAEFFPPITFSASDDRSDDLLRVMSEVNLILESWIRENPAQWLWLHRRWPKELYR